MDEPQLVPVSLAGEYLEVHPTCLKAHQDAGWSVCEKRAPAEDADAGDDIGGAMQVAEIRAALTAKGIAFDPAAKKADLRALLKAANASA